MSKLHIVTDSTCHIPSALRRELDIRVVPLPFVWDGKTYLDDEVEPKEFYARLRTARTLPTTSGPTPGSFKTVFESLGTDGGQVLAVLMGKELSSTLNAASLARDLCPGLDITIFNTDTTNMALGFLALAAARAAREGKDLADILSMLTRLRTTTGVLFAVHNLDYLVHGGRISHLQRIIASVLDLFPIMELRGGRIKLVERVRSEKNVPTRLMDLVAQRVMGERPFRIAVVHSDTAAKAQRLVDEVRSRLDPDELILTEVSPVQGIHTGPDALGLAYSLGA